MDERLQFVARRRAHGGTLQGVWNLPQDRLQDLRSLPGIRGTRANGPKPASLFMEYDLGYFDLMTRVVVWDGFSERGKTEPVHHAPAQRVVPARPQMPPQIPRPEDPSLLRYPRCSSCYDCSEQSRVPGSPSQRLPNWLPKDRPPDLCRYSGKTGVA